LNHKTSADQDGKVGYAFVHTIGGKSVASPSVIDVINPATGTVFAQSPDATQAQLDEAVDAARQAFCSWSHLSFAERRAYLHRFAEKVRQNADELATLVTREQGKPFAAAQREIAGTCRSFEEISKIEVPDEILRDDGKNRISLHYRPMGVVGGITPWNVPVGLAAHKIAQALDTGNTLVLKPSPYTPLATLLLGELSQDILPPGVLNIISGGNDLGRWPTEHPGVDKISFTGSGPTGKRVMASAAGTLKRVSLELGGNDPAIVLDDANLGESLPKIFHGAFWMSGQVCMAVKRVYVPDNLYDRVCDSFVAMAGELRVGEGFEPGVTMGPLQNKMQFDKVLGMLDETKRRPGVKVLTGGHAFNRPGYFIEPTIIADVEDDAPIVAEEQFGPVLPVLRYSDVEDVIERANDTRMGLSASVWTGDIERGRQVAERIEAGTVWVNHHLGSEPDIPFGGFKESGLGREQGLMGLHGYMEAQVINLPKAGQA